MTTATTVADARPPVQFIPLELIDPGANYRKSFDKKKLDELAASIKKQGVIEPVVVRPSAKKPDRFELLIGSRRDKASRLAGMHDIMAIVRQLSDSEAAELQLIENIQREDVPPLEEADALEALHKKHGYSIDQIADKTSKSKAWIYARMKLCALSPACRKAFGEDALSSSVALLLARIPVAKLQDEALKEMKRMANYGDETISFRTANRVVQERFMLKLADAPFNANESKLTKAGACSECPKRTGNQPDMVDDGIRPDICTDPICFGEKKDAAWKQQKDAATRSGQKALSDAESKKLFPYEHSRPTGYADLSQKCEDDPKGRNWRSLLGKDAPKPVLARDAKGKVHELVPLDQAKTALKKAGVKLESHSSSGSTSSFSKRQRDDQKKAKSLNERIAVAMGEIVGRAETRQPNDAWTKLFVHVLVDRLAGHETILDIVKRRKLKAGPHEEQTALRRAAAGMKSHELRGLAVEIVAHSRATSYSLKPDQAFQAFAKFYGVKLKKGGAK